MFQIIEFKHKQEKTTGPGMSASAVVSAYNSNMRLATSEEVSVGFVDSVILVWGAILRHAALRQLLVAAEERFGKSTPFDSVYKLEAVVHKADRDVDKIMWELMGIIDLVLNGYPKYFSLNLLTEGFHGQSDLQHILLFSSLNRSVKLTSTNR